MNPFGSFESNASFESMPFSEDENLAPFVDGLGDESYRSLSFSATPRGRSRYLSELPPSSLSTASGPSVPSASSSTIGSPYSGQHSICYPEAWGPSNNGLGIGPAIVSHDGYLHDVEGYDLEPELSFTITDKVSDDFVGESAGFPSVHAKSATLFSGRASELSSSLPSRNGRRASFEKSSLTIDSVLEQANTTSARRQASFPLEVVSAPPVTQIPTTAAEGHRDHPPYTGLIFKSPTTLPSSLTKTAAWPPSALQLASRSASSGSAASGLLNTPQGPSCAQLDRTDASAGSHHFQPHFFAHSSGSFGPPLESSCRFPLFQPFPTYIHAFWHPNTLSLVDLLPLS